MSHPQSVASTSSNPNAFYLSILSHLPTVYADGLRQFCSTDESKTLVDAIIRFMAGAPAPSLPFTDSGEWAIKQVEAKNELDRLLGRDANNNNSTGLKRPRDDAADNPTTTESSTKRPKMDLTMDTSDDPTDDAPLHTLYDISTNSPIRKKVDITIHQRSLRFTHPTTKVVEASVPLDDLKRVLLVPTRGKPKAHWTVIILSCDVTPKAPPKAKAQQANAPPPRPTQQIIFGLNAVGKMSSQNYSDTNGKTTSTDGYQTLLSHLQCLPKRLQPPLIPEIAVFRSAIQTSPDKSGVPGIEAYLGAKTGTLWFFSGGILWGESKPCEYWAVEDLVKGSEAVRVISPTGRSCSVLITRKDEVVVDNGEEDMGVETEFTMVDGREQDGIRQWVKERKNLFGRPDLVAQRAQNPSLVPQAEDSDEDDESFKGDSGSDGGSPSFGSESDSDSEGGSGSGGGGGSDEEAEARESGDEDAEGDDDEEELDPARHPLMREGAMPKRMSKAAMDMVVGMMGGEPQGDEMEEDELKE